MGAVVIEVLQAALFVGVIFVFVLGMFALTGWVFQSRTLGCRIAQSEKELAQAQQHFTETQLRVARARLRGKHMKADKLQGYADVAAGDRDRKAKELEALLIEQDKRDYAKEMRKA